MTLNNDMETVRLREQERKALCLAIQGVWRLAMVRGEQLVAEQKCTQMYAEGERRIEAQSEAQDAEIEALRAEAKEASADKQALLAFERWTTDLASYVRTARIGEPENAEHAARLLLSAHHNIKADRIVKSSLIAAHESTIVALRLEIAGLTDANGEMAVLVANLREDVRLRDERITKQNLTICTLRSGQGPG